MSPLTNKKTRTYQSTVLAGILLLGALALSLSFGGAPASDAVRSISLVVRPLPGLPGYVDEPYTLFADGVVIREDLTDADGVILFDHIPGTQVYEVELVNGYRFVIRPTDSTKAADRALNPVHPSRP